MKMPCVLSYLILFLWVLWYNWVFIFYRENATVRMVLVELLTLCENIWKASSWGLVNIKNIIINIVIHVTIRKS